MHRFVAVLLAISVSGLGQEPAPVPGRDRPQPRPAWTADRSYPEVVAPPRVGISLTQTKLSLAEAIQMALANNLDIEIDKTNVSIRRGGRPGGARVLRSQLPLGAGLQSGERADRLGAAGRQRHHSPTGTSAATSTTARCCPRTAPASTSDFLNNKATTTNPFSSFVPAYQSRLIVGFTQPLLRNRETDQYRTELQVRQKQVDVSKLDFETRVIDIVTQVQTAYWNLAAARADAEVNRETAGQAQEQLAINRRMVKAGTVAPVELAASEAELERRLDSFYSSLRSDHAGRESVEDAAVEGSRFRYLARRNHSHRPRAPARSQVRRGARRHGRGPAAPSRIAQPSGVRQEINDVQKELRQEPDEAADRYRRPVPADADSPAPSCPNRTRSPLRRPLSTTGSTTLSVPAGLAPLYPATGNLPEFLAGGYGTNLGNLFGGRYQSFQAGISLDLTIHNRTANANYAQTVIAERRLKLEQTRTEQLIEAQVRNSLQGIESSKQRITAAKRASGRRARSSKARRACTRPASRRTSSS